MNNGQPHSPLGKIRSSRFGVLLLIVLIVTAFGGCAHNTKSTHPPRDKHTLQAYPNHQLESAMTSLGPAQSLSHDMNIFVNTDIYFEFDSYSLTTGSEEILLEMSTFLNKHPEFSLQVEGHCDERGTTEYNLALGEKRAESARQYLVNLGVAVERVEIISYGKEKPIDPNHNKEAWAKNRRAHFNIINQ